MPWFKKSKKSRTPSEHPISLVIPTHVALGPLGFSADLGIDTAGMYVQLGVNLTTCDSLDAISSGFNGEGSRISLLNRWAGGRRFPASETTPTPADGNDVADECRLWLPGLIFTTLLTPQTPEYEHEAHSSLRKEELDQNASNLRSVDGKSEARDRGEHEWKETVTKRSPELAHQPAFAGNQDDQDTFQERMEKNRKHSGSETGIPLIAVSGTEYRNHPTGGCF